MLQFREITIREVKASKVSGGIDLSLVEAACLLEGVVEGTHCARPALLECLQPSQVLAVGAHDEYVVLLAAEHEPRCAVMCTEVGQVLGELAWQRLFDTIGQCDELVVRSLHDLVLLFRLHFDLLLTELTDVNHGERERWRRQVIAKKLVELFAVVI